MHMGMASAQEDDIPWTLTDEEFPKNLEFPPTSPKLRTGRRRTSEEEETKMRQRTLGESRRLAIVSRPDICAGSAKIASRIGLPT